MNLLLMILSRHDSVSSPRWRKDSSQLANNFVDCSAKAQNKAMLAISPKSETFTWQVNPNPPVNLPFPTSFFASSQCNIPTCSQAARTSNHGFHGLHGFLLSVASAQSVVNSAFGCGSAAPRQTN